jgi:superfamily I DNA and RNA helicase
MYDTLGVFFSFDSLYDYLEGIGNRNYAFATITRSKAWVRITGVGKQMDAAKKEVDNILADIPKFKFTFPDMKNVRRLSAENSNKRRKVRQADKAVDILNSTEIEALAKLASTNPEKFKEACKRFTKIIEDLDENQ